MPRPVSLRFELAVSICVTLAGTILAWQVSAALRQPLDAEDMKIDAADLGSYAAEGELLARQRIGASLTRNYADVQSEMWREKIQEVAHKYESRDPAADLTDSFQDIHALARRLQTAAEAVSDAFSHGRTPTAAAADLKRIEADARQVKSRLMLRSDEAR